MFKYKFNDQFMDKNCNNLTHLGEKNGIIQSVMFGCTLRDDGRKKKKVVVTRIKQKTTQD
jgi:hypothetical protein